MSQDLRRAREISAQTVAEIVHDTNGLSVVQLLSALGEFCEHARFSRDQFTAVSLGYDNTAVVHVSSGHNAAEAVAWAANVLDQPGAMLLKSGANSTHAKVIGQWRGLRITVVAVVFGESAERLDSYVEYDEKRNATITLDLLRELATEAVPA